MAKIAILGCGVVGSGVYEVLNINRDSISNKVKEDISVKYILDLRTFEGEEYAHLVTNDFDKILNDDEVSVVVETMGGVNPAYDFSKKLLLKGKSVVTSNKELVATHGAELLKIAQEKNINYLFEASVGGGIPIIRPLNQCLAANEISSVKGILNGTTNYILTKMFKEGAEFKNALLNAQKKGYAEKDPTADVEGYDACRKLAILTSLISGKNIDYNKIETKGITELTSTDVLYAEKCDMVIKLIASAIIENDKVYTSVEPSLVSLDHPLSGVENVFNGIFLNGNALGDVMFYGKGAGKLPTASAVVADVIDAVKNKDKNNKCMWVDDGVNYVVPYEETSSSFMIRIKGEENNFKDILNELKAEKTIKVKDGEFAVIIPEMKISKLDAVTKDLPILNKLRICK